jgi:hypothetical protein
MPVAMGDPHTLQCFAYAGLAFTRGNVLVVEQGQLDILGDVELVDEIEALKYKSDCALAQSRELRFRITRDIAAIEPVLTAARTVEQEGPITAMNSPTATSRLMSRSAVVSTSAVR